MADRYEITFHPDAGSDLDVIDEFIASVAGHVVADRIVGEISARISDLADIPHIGTIRNEISPGLRTVATAGKATICFIVNDQAQTVKIICVAYAGQDWQSTARARETSGDPPAAA